jgi:hypothetical protein
MKWLGTARRRTIAMPIKSIGIDLGKTNFHLAALNSRSQAVVRKKFSRPQLLTYTATLPSSLIGMEACERLHLLGRALREQGHFSAPDSGAVCATVREVDQERLLRCGGHCRSGGAREHAIRAHQDGRSARSASSAPSTGAVVSRRTNAINQIRAFLLERGISFAKGRHLAERLSIDPSNLSKELGRPERDGLFRSEVNGRQEYFQLNREYPLFMNCARSLRKPLVRHP